MKLQIHTSTLFLNKKPLDIVFLVATNDDDKVLGAIHAIKSGLEVYSHILSDLTIVIRPEFQSQGIGHKLAFVFLDHIFNERLDIMRVEMEVVNNLERVKVYEEVGFVKEGEAKKRIKRLDGTFSNSVLLAWENPNFTS